MAETNNPSTANKLAILSAKTGKPIHVLVQEAMGEHRRIEDAARALGVSRQTLSYYLNHRLDRELEMATVGK